MRFLIIGGGGMLGHMLLRSLSASHDVSATFRREPSFALPGTHIHGVDVLDPDSLVQAIAAVKPDVVINCAGVIKQLPAASDPIRAISVNALFPHRLASLCRCAGSRLIHISTDCVFSGTRGGYSEEDVCDAADLYGRSKHLGEVSGEGCLTLRTSIIGPELGTRHGLLEWFLAQAGRRVSGYCRAIYTGLTTLELGRVIEMVSRRPELSGIYQVASERIAKHDLLALIRDAYGISVNIVPDDSVIVDRSLHCERFWAETAYRAPSWPRMVAEMAADHTNSYRRAA